MLQTVRIVEFQMSFLNSTGINLYDGVTNLGTDWAPRVDLFKGVIGLDLDWAVRGEEQFLKEGARFLAGWWILIPRKIVSQDESRDGDVAKVEIPGGQIRENGGVEDILTKKGIQLSI